MSSFYNVDAWQKANHNTPYEWDYSLGPSRTMVTQYDQLWERATDLYSALDSSGDSTSSRSDRTCNLSSERRDSSSTSASTPVKKSIPDKVERRREQNRSSQRAYRERKERHQRELEQQICDWRQKYDLLSQSYSQQNDEVRRLRSRIEHLTSEILTLPNGLLDMCGS